MHLQTTAFSFIERAFLKKSMQSMPRPCLDKEKTGLKMVVVVET